MLLITNLKEPLIFGSILFTAVSFGIKKEFTSYKLENVVKLKSSYAIRIYELLKQYEKLQERTFLLDDLRKMLGAEDIYPAYGNFKQRVLMPAQKN